MKTVGEQAKELGKIMLEMEAETQPGNRADALGVVRGMLSQGLVIVSQVEESLHARDDKKQKDEERLAASLRRSAAAIAYAALVLEQIS